MEPTLPIIDLSPYLQGGDTKPVANAIREACKKVGFFYVKNHGVPEDLRESFFESCKKFFSLPRQQKRQIRMEKSGRALRGYYEVGEEKTNGKIDYHEGVYMSKEQDENHPRVLSKTPLHGQNLYPEQVPELKRDVQRWLAEMNRLGELLMGAFAESLCLQRQYFAKTFTKDHYGLMFLLHYPERPAKDRETQPLGEHCDYGFLTMLTVSDEGLQAKDVNNEWIKVNPIPGTFIINIGDMLQKVTKGLYKSTVHRVVCTGKQRFSMPYFYDPGWQQTIYEIDFPMSEDEEDVVKKTKAYKRIDQIDLDKVKETIGEYYIRKHASTFPELTEKYLKV